MERENVYVLGTYCVKYVLDKKKRRRGATQHEKHGEKPKAKSQSILRNEQHTPVRIGDKELRCGSGHVSIRKCK